jgi:hypothetical protein
MSVAPQFRLAIAPDRNPDLAVAVELDVEEEAVVAAAGNSEDNFLRP